MALYAFPSLFLLTILFLVMIPSASAQQGQTPWTQWSLCPVSCGGGMQERFRDCFDGSLCSLGRLTETRNCGEGICPVNGGWRLWEAWTSCSVTCGKGKCSRVRTCDEPIPEFGGKFCVGGNPANIDRLGVEQEWKECYNQPCIVDGAWAEWSAWAECSSTCKNGMTERNRNCTNPAPAHGGLICDGISKETKRCNVHVQCPIDGAWMEWSQWCYCSSSCAGGVTLRTRTCTNPYPLFGGKDCIGATRENKTCNDHIPCPVNGEWQTWGMWSACSSTCAGGQLTRTRECSAPLNGGYVCMQGEASESLPCNAHVVCPIDGNWAMWNQWAVCTSTCAGGTRLRGRTCTNPAPSAGGSYCVGEASDTAFCNENIECPVDGNWSAWSLWSQCTAPCGGGQQSRTRACSAPAPLFGGVFCVGSEVDTINCNMNVPCP